MFLAKIRKLETLYKSIRRARGDGNCFFRSFIFAYMENLVHTADLTERNRYTCGSCSRNPHLYCCSDGYNISSVCPSCTLHTRFSSKCLASIQLPTIAKIYGNDLLLHYIPADLRAATAGDWTLAYVLVLQQASLAIPCQHIARATH